MIIKSWMVAGAALVVVGLLVADRCGSTAAWEAKLAHDVAEVQGAKTADSLAAVAERQHFQADSARADSVSRADSTALAEAKRTRDNAAREAARARVAVDVAKAALAAAGTLPDSVRALVGVVDAQGQEITRLAVVVQQDSVALRASEGVTSGLRSQLGLSQAHSRFETLRADTAEARLARIMASASNRPTGINLLGLHLALKPYLGVGVNYAPTAGDHQLQPGLQAGLSILRGN